VPDAAGHVRTVLPYEAPPMPADCSQGSRVEEPTVLATVRVPDAGVDRVVHFVTQLGLGGDAGIGSALCLATG